MSRAYEPTDDQVSSDLDTLRSAAVEEHMRSRPDELMPHYVLGVIGARLESVAEASTQADRSLHVRKARSMLLAYDAWRDERYPPRPVD